VICVDAESLLRNPLLESGGEEPVVAADEDLDRDVRPGPELARLARRLR
jgi:hypothetical protein